MVTLPFRLDRADPTMAAAVVVAVVGAAALLGAWIFQYGLGLVPCPLCLEQRVPYYFAIPLSALVILGVVYGASPRVLMVAMVAIAAAMLWNAGLGAYHSGIEWKWWPGPTECAGVPNFSGRTDIMERLSRSIIVRCDEAPWRFLGLSLAGYNVLISLGLAAVALWGAFARRPAAYGSSSVSQ